MTHGGCMRGWRDVGKGDMKILRVHMIAMEMEKLSQKVLGSW